MFAPSPTLKRRHQLDRLAGRHLYQLVVGIIAGCAVWALTGALLAGVAAGLLVPTVLRVLATSEPGPGGGFGGDGGGGS
jgi:hypothetical protein